MSRYLLLALVASFLAFAGGACGSGNDDEASEGEGGGGGGGETIEITGTEFALDPATVELDEAGTYTFRFVNDGGTVHALEIEGHGVEEETEEIDAGESAEVTVDLSESGEYEMYCPVGNHKDEGMEGTVVVGGAGAGAGGTMTDETTTEDDDETTTEEDSGYNYR